MDDKHVAALLEDLRGQFKVFGEALQATRTEFGAALQETRVELGGKIDDVAADVAGLKTDVAGLKTDRADVKARLTRVEHGLNGGSKKAPPTARTPKKK